MSHVCAQKMVAYVLDRWSCLILRILIDGRMVILTDRWSYQRLSNWVLQTFMYSPLMHPYMEITCGSTPKDRTPRLCLPYMVRKAQDLGALTPNLLCKEKPYIQGILANSTPLYKHWASSFLRYMQFPSSYTFEIGRAHV